MSSPQQSNTLIKEELKKEELKNLNKKLFKNISFGLIAMIIIAPLIALSPLVLSNLLVPCTIIGMLAIKMVVDIVITVKKRREIKDTTTNAEKEKEPIKDERNKSIWNIIFFGALSTVSIVVGVIFSALTLTTLIVPITNFIIGIVNTVFTTKKLQPITESDVWSELKEKEIKKLNIFAGLSITSAVIAITFSIAVAVVTGGWGLLIGAMITSAIAIGTAISYKKQVKKLSSENLVNNDEIIDHIRYKQLINKIEEEELIKKLYTKTNTQKDKKISNPKNIKISNTSAKLHL